MQRVSILVVGLVLSLLSAGAHAAGPPAPPPCTNCVTTPGGTAGRVPKFNGTLTVDNSNITDSGTTVGVGGAFTVDIATGNVTTGGNVNAASASVTGNVAAGSMSSTGNVVVGNDITLDAAGGAISAKGVTAIGDDGGLVGWDTLPTGPRVGMQGFSDADNGAGVFGRANGCDLENPLPSPVNCTTGAGGVTSGVRGIAFSPRGHAVRGDLLSNVPISAGRGVLGTVGFRKNLTVNPDATGGIAVHGVNAANGGGATAMKGEATQVCSGPGCPFTIGVTGLVRSAGGTAGLFENTSGGGFIIEGYGLDPVGGGRDRKFLVAADGNVFADGSFNPGGADFAESVAVHGDRAGYEPGDVLVVDASGRRRLALSQEAYATSVAGIYSTKPGVLASPHSIDARPDHEVPVAIVGIVPCKVTAANGAIQAGDLLVTSSRPGRAMKGTDRSRMLGAVVGKALEPLADGEGVIEVLVTLQ